MFCPTCGSNQGEGRKYCTGCGTNLLVVLQLLSAPKTHPHQVPPSDHKAYKKEKRKAAGVKLAIIGGGIVAYKLFGFIFAGPFKGGSPVDFLTIVGFILLGIGISKIISSRAPLNLPAQPPPSIPNSHVRRDSQLRPQPEPVFSATPGSETRVPDTGELEPARDPGPSVTEDDTRQLPEFSQPRKFP
jgi:hypothetical protein